MNTRSFKNLWEAWDIQIVTIISLLLQILLIFSAPLRKPVSTGLIVFPMWLAYLLADAVPVYVTGLISHRKSSSFCSEYAIARSSDDLIVLWVPFFLLHLGGPDTITAFSLEDNELWHRHVLNLGVQCAAFIYALYLSFPGNKLMLPTVLIFVAGFIKYAERTCCIYRASSRGLAKSLILGFYPGADYEMLINEYASNLEAGIPTKIHRSPDLIEATKATNEEMGPLSGLRVIQRAHHFLRTFKGLITDLRFSSLERSEVRSYFLKRDAFNIIEVELNFFYDILYTKVLVVQGKNAIPLRVAPFGLCCAALVFFKLQDQHKQEYTSFDLGLTYTLFGGAIAFDVISCLKIPFSNWTAAVLCDPHRRIRVGSNNKLQNNVELILIKIFRLERQRWPSRDSIQPPTFSFCDVLQIGHRSWSESVSQYSLIDYCLRPRSQLAEYSMDLIPGLTNILDTRKYVKSKEFRHEFRDIIFDELKMKSNMAEDSDTRREISSARGDWVIRFYGFHNLLSWLEDVDYDEIIMMWHIATELLYNTDNAATGSNTRDSNSEEKSANQETGGSEMDFKGLSKVLSDYMLYLLIRQTTIMSTLAGISQIRYGDTCAEAKRHFRKRKNISKIDEVTALNTLENCSVKLNMSGEEIRDKALREACEGILSVKTLVKPRAIRGDKSKSVLFDACMLAKELNKLGDSSKDRDAGDEDIEEEKRVVDKWRLICRVWIEMMCYAAPHCKGTTHAAQLSKGGQLITLIWLLMAHLGLGEFFQADH